MRTVGIIAEFNPFHKGHEYLIKCAKEQTHADNVVIICSGNFVQRGFPSIINKYIKSQMALNNGADVIFELPVYYSSASAELFAQASVKFLQKLNCIDFLCFGCEDNSILNFNKLAEILLKEPEYYKNLLYQYTCSGNSFPKARMMALKDYCAKENILIPNIDSLLGNPNNILAIEYIKAIQKFNCSFVPFPIQRMGAHYNSSNISTDFSSATAIRKLIIESNSSSLKGLIPDNCLELLGDKYITMNDFSNILSYKLIENDDYSNIYGINKDLSNRIGNQKQTFTNIDKFIVALQSKNYTYSGISRALLHLILGIDKSVINLAIKNDYFSYGKILGLNTKSNILSKIKKDASIDLITKLPDYLNNCDPIKKQLLDIEIKSDSLYRSIYMNKYQVVLPSIFQEQIRKR